MRLAGFWAFRMEKLILKISFIAKSEIINTGSPRIMMSERLNYQAVAPQGLKALGSIYAYVHQSGLDSSLVEMVYLRVSQINGCAYCLDLHTRDLLKKGISYSKLALVQVWREAGSLFSARERAALRWAESVTNVSNTGVPDEDYATASSVLSEKELVDLTIAIGLMNTFNRMAIAFRRQPEAVSAAA